VYQHLFEFVGVCWILNLARIASCLLAYPCSSYRIYRLGFSFTRDSERLAECPARSRNFHSGASWSCVFLTGSAFRISFNFSRHRVEFVRLRSGPIFIEIIFALTFFQTH